MDTGSCVLPLCWYCSFYSTRYVLRMPSLRMSARDFEKFMNLQGSICAEFKEEIRIRNRKVQWGRQISFFFSMHCNPAYKKLLEHPSKPLWLPIKRSILSKIDLTTTFVFSTFKKYLVEISGLFSPKNIVFPSSSVLSSSMLSIGRSDRRGGSG